MTLDRTFVGRVYRDERYYEVGREKIREFAEAVGDPHPAFTDPAAAQALGRPDVIAPPTFPIVLSMRAESAAVLDPRLGFDFSRVVHREQRFAYARPVRAGDRLTVTVTITRADTVGGNDLVEFDSEIRTTGGELVCTTTTSLVSRAPGDETETP
ncbi:Acyl dehydratase [Thermomonospora echinospora]|uniref:UPF0336 protein SAMN04489712_102303 n=1 Tax=Thermomonospora echinospora TaxID=1992 RepID=A0A1H5VFF2_9ACTN|nr:MaoC family dehydratase N-terminal domain-containing protein [Thermomonospora echinospora]SEF86049.1 Acyl dehydratase [Thermomonospora echinospora]